MSVKVGKWWCSSSYLHGRYGGCHFWLTAVWLCAIKESALQQAQQVRWKHINMMRTHESDVQHWQSHGCIVYHKRPSMRLSTHTSTNSSHLIITHGTAILSNQDIHQVRVPFTVSQQNRCLTLLQGVETFTVGDGWMQGQIPTQCYNIICITQHGLQVKQPKPNPSSCTASTFGASTSHETTHCQTCLWMTITGLTQTHSVCIPIAVQFVWKFLK